MKVGIFNSFENVFKTVNNENELSNLKGKVKCIATSFHEPKIILDRDKVQIIKQNTPDGDVYLASIKATGQIIGSALDPSELMKSKYDLLKLKQFLSGYSENWIIALESMHDLVKLGIGKIDTIDPEDRFPEFSLDERRTQTTKITFNEFERITQIDSKYLFEYDGEGRPVRAITPQEIVCYKYDVSFNILSEEVYSKAGDLPQNIFIHCNYKHIYELYKLNRGHTVEEKHVFLFDEESRIEQYFKFIARTEIPEEIFEKYDDRRIIDSYPANINFVIEKSCTFEYSTDRVVQLKEYDFRGDVTKSRSASARDENELEGIVKEFIQELSSEQIRELDDLLNCIEGEIAKPETNLNRASLLKGYEFEYDNNQNWIQKIEFIDGKPNLITKRIIEYY